MHHTETELQTADGLSLYGQMWQPEDAPKAALAMSHGQSEHSGRYDHVAAVLTEAGYALVMADLRGHGKSPGPHGHINTWLCYLNDYQAIFEAAQQIEGPTFIAGHSLGGLIALNSALNMPNGAAGVIASSPFLALGFEPPGWRLLLAQFMANVIPGFSQDTGLEADALSHDESVVRAYEADPLVHGTITARAFTEILEAQEETFAHAGKLDLPLLILHGSDDSITAPDASRRFYEKAGSDDKTFHMYDGYYHELFNEQGKEQVFSDLITWLDAHV